MNIPREHYRYILGAKGKKLADLELETATKILIPRQEDTSELIKITGNKEGLDRAMHEIQLISDEQVGWTVAGVCGTMGWYRGTWHGWWQVWVVWNSMVAAIQ